MEQQAKQKSIGVSKFECDGCGNIVEAIERPKSNCPDCKNGVFRWISTMFTEEEINWSMKAVQDCYNAIIEVLNNYMDIEEDAKKIIAVWIIGTYIHKEMKCYPYLFFNAMKGSGKTRLLKIIESLAWNGKLVNNASESSLFRSANTSTLLFDEIEQVSSKEKNTFRELMNSGYKKGSYVERMKKVRKDNEENFEHERFLLYGPKAMANINGMEDVLGDRCIVLILEKSSNKRITSLIEDFDEDPLILSIKRTLEKIGCSLCSVVTKKNIHKGWNSYVNNMHNYITTYNTYTTLYTLTTPNDILISEKEIKLFEKIASLDLNGRYLELFLPLIFTADLIGENVVNEVLEVAGTMTEKKMKEQIYESVDISLYEYISTLEPLRYYPIIDIVNGFKHVCPADGEGLVWLNPKWMGRALSRLNLVSTKRRKKHGIEVMLNVSKSLEKIGMFKNNDKEDGS